MIKTISIIGLGKLGSPMVAAFASRGYNVIGVDINKKLVQAVARGKAPVEEPDLQAFLSKYRNRITATTDVKKAVLNSEITFIIVPTPSAANGSFITTYAKEAAKGIGTALREKKGYHLIALTSTVLPGACEKDIIPALEKFSGKKCGTDFGFCYNPEFIALGSVIKDLLNPDFILVGEADKRSADLLQSFYSRIHKAPLRRMKIINAELVKIAINSFITTKISFANMIAQICDQLPQGDVDVVTQAIGFDTRIGQKYLRGGLGFGGPCFPRDNRAFQLIAKAAKASYNIPAATDRTNKGHLAFIIKKMLSVTAPGAKVALLGLSYKPNTGVVEESHSLYLAEGIAKKGFAVSCYDPGVQERKLSDRFNLENSLEKTLKGAATICIATPWDDFKNLKEKQLEKDAVIIDFWRILNAKNFPSHRIIQFGLNNKQ